MADLDQATWQAWIDAVSRALDVDPATVDVAEIHDLTKQVSQRFERPMAPVSAYLLGLAEASHPDVPREQLRDAILSAIPEAPGE